MTFYCAAYKLISNPILFTDPPIFFCHLAIQVLHASEVHLFTRVTTLARSSTGTFLPVWLFTFVSRLLWLFPLGSHAVVRNFTCFSFHLHKLSRHLSCYTAALLPVHLAKIVFLYLLVAMVLNFNADLNCLINCRQTSDRKASVVCTYVCSVNLLHNTSAPWKLSFEVPTVHQMQPFYQAQVRKWVTEA